MKNINTDNEEKDVSKYGEWVCSQFAWLPIDKQKENAKRFEKITKKKNEK